MPAGYYVRKTRKVPYMAPPEQDWPGVIKALLRAGVPKMRIAWAVNCSREHVESLLNDRVEPKWSVGHSLIALLNHVEKA